MRISCGAASDAMTPADRQQVSDFTRFLSMVGPPGERIYVDWRWLAYVRGEMGAPPLMWEGDNA